MPEYDFKCQQGHTFSAILPMMKSDKAICPEHGIESKQKIISMPYIGRHHTESLANEAQVLLDEARSVDIKGAVSDVSRQIGETIKMVESQQRSQQ